MHELVGGDLPYPSLSIGRHMGQPLTKPIIDFASYIAERTFEFTGREWVFKAINDWLVDTGEPRFFLLTGHPGSGKTAIAARLAQLSQGELSPPPDLSSLRPNFLSAVHFCFARDRRWINPHTFTESLAMQLAARLPAYALALAEKGGDSKIRIEVVQNIENVRDGTVVGVAIERLDVSVVSAEDAFIRVIREPLEALRGSFDEQVIILPAQ